MNKREQIKNSIILSVLISLSVVLSLFDRFISQGILTAFPVLGLMAPNFKLGIANIVILIIIYNYSFKMSFISVILKVILVGLFNPSGIPMSFGGTIISFFAMYLLYKIINNKNLIIFVSSVGGFFHSFGQILFGFIYYGLIDITQTLLTGKVDINVLIYSPIMLLMGLITGVIMGVISKKLNEFVNDQNIIVKNRGKTMNKCIYIAHRGSKVNGGVENTMEAFHGGITAGASGLECDIRFTKDNVIIISHDPTVERLTEECREYHLTNVNDVTYEELKNIELIQEYQNEKYKGHICLFEDYLVLCEKNNVIPVIELKWTNGIYSDNNNKDVFDYSNIDKVIKIIEKHGLLDKCYIISFMSGCVEYIKTKYPGVKLQWLCSSNVNDNVEWCLNNGVDIDINYNYCSKELVDKFHNKNLKVNIWTLNDQTLLDKYLEMGVDMITSDWIIK